MRIGELSSRTGVSIRSLRYYEEQDLLQSARTAGGHREYPERAVDRVIRIQELFAAGLGSRRIAQILPCMRDADGGPAETATPLLTHELLDQRAQLDACIADLLRARDVLDGVLDGVGAAPQSDRHVGASR